MTCIISTAMTEVSHRVSHIRTNTSTRACDTVIHTIRMPTIAVRTEPAHGVCSALDRASCAARKQSEKMARNFKFVLNLRIAKTLGFTFPPSLFARADEVNE
jgi:hypothetical protein